MNNLKRLFFNHYYLLTSLLMFLSFPSYDFILFKIFTVAAWFSFIPLFLYVRNKPLKEVFFTVFVTGLAGNFLAYGWIGNFGAKVPGGYIVILLFLIPSLTVFLSVKIVAAEFLSRKYPRLLFIIYPSVWIIVDFIQSIGHLAFPWTYIGYSQFLFIPFIQIVSITGVLGVNFIMILFNVTVSEYISEFFKMEGEIKERLMNCNVFRLSIIIMLIVVFTAAGFIRLNTDYNEGKAGKLKLSLVQSCISPWENWNGNKFRYLDELFRYTEKSLEGNPDFIIWSESATLELISFRASVGQPDLFDKKLTEFVRSKNRLLLTGEIGLVVKKSLNGPRFYPQNNAVLLNSSGDVVQTYPKIHLVPFGEWFPYETWFPPVKRLVESFGGSDFVPGKRPMLFNVDNLRFGSLICYEGIFFRLCREYRRLGADFFVNITNDGWTDAYNGHYQHFSASIFRSIENGIWMARCGNTGVTALIDPKGRIVKSIPILRKGYLNGEIDTSLNLDTFYTRHGDLILYFSMLFIVLLSVLLITGKLFEKTLKDDGKKSGIS